MQKRRDMQQTKNKTNKKRKNRKCNNCYDYDDDELLSNRISKAVKCSWELFSLCFANPHRPFPCKKTPRHEIFLIFSRALTHDVGISSRDFEFWVLSSSSTWTRLRLWLPTAMNPFEPKHWTFHKSPPMAESVTQRTRCKFDIGNGFCNRIIWSDL